MKITNIKFILISAILLLTWGIAYQDALLGMEAIWRRSDTFAHGYFILPISIWLIWRDRAPLLKSEVTFSWWAAIFMVGGLALGIVAFAADVAVVQQLSAVFVFVCLIWALLGNGLTWHYRFPIAFLIFAVPLGENLIPWLQDVTAWITVFLLKIHGIPVFRDGLYIQVPSGMFEVAVACSGIRYLIASVAVGTLYAYLTYNKARKQVLFILFAIVLPIIANGIRAYLIVIIAHYSDMKYATGADHLVYGWLFFGVVIMLMFWIGGRFADDLATDANHEVKYDAKKNQHWLWFCSPVTVITLTLYLKAVIPVTKTPEQATQMLDASAISQSQWGIKYQHALAMSHVKITDGIEYFVAKYGNKQDVGELINFANILYDFERWTITDTEVFSHAFAGESQTFGLVRLKNTRGEVLTYLYQYQIGKDTSASAVHTKILQVWNTLTRTSDYSYIRAVAVFGDNHLQDNKDKLLVLMKQMKQQERH